MTVTDLELGTPPSTVSTARPMLSGAAARIFSFIPTAIATVISTRLILTHFGEGAFNQYTLAITLIALIPLNDLGVGAAVSSAVASSGARDPAVQRAVLTGLRVVTGSALVLIVASCALQAGDLWNRILGESFAGGWFYAASMAVYALSFVPAVAQGVLLGLHKNHLTILVNSLFVPIALGGVVLLVHLDAEGRWLILVPAASVLAVNLLTFAMSARVARLPWLRLLGAVPDRRVHGSSLRHIARPRLIIQLTIPLALASDRVVLSHFSTSYSLTQYSLAMQVFAPIVALLGAASQPLWPIFVSARARGEKGPSLWRLIGMFVGLTAVVSLAVMLLANPIADVLSANKVRLGRGLPAALALMMLVGAAVFPISMALTSPRQLRFVARMAVIALPVNVTLSVVLAKHIGAAGPLVATSIVAFLLQTVPALLYLHYRPDESGPRPASEGGAVGSTG